MGSAIEYNNPEMEIYIEGTSGFYPYYIDKIENL
jgi:hypothetical protein